MNFLLLTGAGFSRNWSGWLGSEVFDYLLGCREVLEDQKLRALLWRFADTGFEYALADLQTTLRTTSALEDRVRLGSMEQAILRMFKDLNASLEKKDLYFRGGFGSNNIWSFLSRFHAIFTLNQDLFLESKYLPTNYQNSEFSWTGHQLPGMAAAGSHGPSDQGYWTDSWVPKNEDVLDVDAGRQPLFKLHGSSNWRDARTVGHLLIMGGDKVGSIDRVPVLKRYAQKFDELLRLPNTRLMIIGYGFRDEHINRSITTAVETHGLKDFFNIAPEGAEHARRARDAGADGERLENAFERGLIGASRRLLAETFGGDDAEWEKVHRFFAD